MIQSLQSRPKMSQRSLMSLDFGGSKGIFYTLFVIFVLALISSVVMMPLSFRNLKRPGQRMRVNEAHYFLRGVEDDWQRATYIAGRRSLTAVTKLILNQGSPLSQPKARVLEACQEGTIAGNQSQVMVNSTLAGWIDRVELLAAKSDFNLNLTVTEANVSHQGSNVKFSFSYHLKLTDARSSSRFERNESHATLVGLQDLVDTLNYLRSEGEYLSSYQVCNHSWHAQQLTSGSDYYYTGNQSWASGRAAVLNASTSLNSIDNEGEKIAVVDDPCSFSQPLLLEDFAGVIAEANKILDSPCGNNATYEAFINDATDAKALVTDGDLIVMNREQVWVNHLLDQLTANCYFEVKEAPTFFDRLANNLTSASDQQGIASLLAVPDLPNQQQRLDSALDFVYWNESADYGPNYKVKGVTDHRDWFRLDQDHLQRWNMTDLSYE